MTLRRIPMIDVDSDVIKKHVVEKDVEKTASEMKRILEEFKKKHSIKPVSPEEFKKKEKTTSDATIERVNKIIRESWDGEVAVVHLKDLEDTALEIYPDDIREIYRQAGWKIVYSFLDSRLIFTKP